MPISPLSISVLTGIIAILYYILFIPNTVYWLDGPEIISAAFRLGFTHPPGHPVFVVLLKGFLLLPIGSAAFKSNLFSAVFAGVAVGCFTRLCIWTGVLVGAYEKASCWISFVCGLGFAVCYSLSTQAIFIEVYTFNLALVLLAFTYAMLKPGEPKAGVIIGCCLGLGLANHHFLTILAMPGILYGYFRYGMKRWDVVLCASTLVIVTTGSYLMLYARGIAGVWPTWSDTKSLDGVIWMASAKIFSESLGGFSDPLSEVFENLYNVIGIVANNLTSVGFMLAVAGYIFFFIQGERRVVIAVTIFFICSLISKVSMGILDPLNPDDHGYFLPMIAMFFLWYAITFHIWQDCFPRLSPPLVMCSIAPGIQLVMWFFLLSELSSFNDSNTILDMIWKETPPRGVLMLSHYPVYFKAMYDQIVEGKRSDITLVQASLYHKARGGTFYAERLRKDDPDLERICEKFINQRVLDWDEVVNLSKKRPVRFEPAHDLVFPPYSAILSGWTFEVVTNQDKSPMWVINHLQDIEKKFDIWPPEDVETIRVLIYHLASLGQTLQHQGLTEDGKISNETAFYLSRAIGGMRRKNMMYW